MRDLEVAPSSSASTDNPREQEAVARWREILGEERVFLEPRVTKSYSAACEPRSTAVRGVLQPTNTSEISAVLKVGTECGVSLHPISQGKNWGYGSACPPRGNTYLLDMRLMNRILEVNAELAYAVVEPGVTQQQLYDYLTSNNLSLCMDVTGASPEASLIGNMVERGFGQSSYGDRFAHICGMEIVLADGTIFKTGFGHYDSCKSESLYKWGIGPYLDGVFTQSNFGVVTKTAVWLHRKPQYQGLLLLSFESDEKFSAALDELRELKLRGLLSGAVHISNDMRVLSCLTSYPYEAAQNQTPLPENICTELRKRFGVAYWTCFTGLHGTKSEVQMKLREIRKAFGGLSSIQFLPEKRIQLSLQFGKFGKLITGLDSLKARVLLNLIRGCPTSSPLRSAYWRRKGAAPVDYLDPARDNCGVVWCSPVIPNTRNDVAQFLRISRECFRTFGFEFNATVAMVAERASCCTVGIFFDKDSQSETGRAEECHEVLLREYLRHGFVPYRFGARTEEFRDVLFRDEDPYWQVCRRIKKALDPENILSPGKYGLG